MRKIKSLQFCYIFRSKLRFLKKKYDKTAFYFGKNFFYITLTSYLIFNIDLGIEKTVNRSEIMNENFRY